MNKKAPTKQAKKRAPNGESGAISGLTGRVELTDEEADRMVTQALDCDLNEPEPFVKMLVFLNDLLEEGRQSEASDSIHRLMTAAYNNSIVHSANFDEYLESVRRG